MKIKGYEVNLKESHAVAFDFDGVIHKYSKGWQDGSIYDEVNVGVLDIINTLMMNNIPCIIMSTRDPQQIKDWWNEQGFDIKTKVLDFNTVFYNDCDYLGITNRKIAAQLYIDDRAYRYTGQNTDEFLYDLTAESLKIYQPTIIKVGDRVQVLNGSGSCYKTGEIATCIAINVDKNGELKYLFENDKRQWQVLDWKDYKTLNNDTPLLTSLLNCKFTVVKDIDGLTKGKIYEVKNGKFKDDDGDICPMSEELLSEEDLKKYFQPLNSLDVEDSEIITVIKD
ncbi:MAG: hypothetical protein ACLR3W_13665 [Faecalibacillus intestinalis]|uniref:hypothetical protein n=2 Tax=Faecalibacillus intestinalis TaxID=1982626 RepID=UPI0039935F4F